MHVVSLHLSSTQVSSFYFFSEFNDVPRELGDESEETEGTVR